MYVDRERNNKKKVEQVVEHQRKEKRKQKKKKEEEGKVLMEKNEFTREKQKLSHKGY